MFITLLKSEALSAQVGLRCGAFEKSEETAITKWPMHLVLTCQSCQYDAGRFIFP